MSESTSAPVTAAGEAKSSTTPTTTAAAITATSSILGECVLRLTHATTYEPPLYLFPELLPQVPQGTPPLPVWDAVADAVDIAASSWRLADASQLLAAAAAGSGASSSGEDNGSGVAVPRAPQAMITLASMVADSRLLAAGLDASVLKGGSFSASSMVMQLGTLQTRMGLSDEEGAAIMSNHFINLLAWQKLREINGGGCTDQPTEANTAEGHHTRSAASSSSSPSSSTTAVPVDGSGCGGSSLLRKRSRAAEDDEDDVQAWLPSPTPWTTGTELARRGSGTAQKFVAASETNVEDRVELLRTLAALYQRPWRTLSSQGQQTDHVVPPGVVNVTSPYADSSKLPGALIDPVEEMGWGGAAAAAGSSAFFGGVRVARTACFYSVVLSSRAPGDAAAARRIPLKQLVTYLGREAGTQQGVAVAAAALVSVDVGLADFTAHPDVLSKLHCALLLRPTYEHSAALTSTNGAGDHISSKNEGENDLNDDAVEPAEAANTHPPGGDFAVVHTKTPNHYTLWFANYGRNGVRIAGKGWVLAEPRELSPGDVLVFGDAVEVRVEAHPTAAAACAPVAEDERQSIAACTPSQVKRERAEEE